jgi:predicted metalloprotease with PDZ domain
MRRAAAILAGALALATLALAAGSSAAPAPVAYELSPELTDGGVQALDVTVRFRAAAEGTTTFGFASSWAGEDALWTWQRDVHVDGAERVDDHGKGELAIHARAGAPITVRYRIVSAYDHDPSVKDSEQAKPVIRPDWFFAIGHSLFAYPKTGPGREAPAVFTWTGATGFGFASDLEHLSGPGRRGIRPGVVEDVLDSVVIGGRDMRLSTVSVDGAPIRIATIGRYDFDLDLFQRQLLQIIAAERGFWRDRGAPFLVAMSPVAADPGLLSFSGTGLADSFALWAPRDVPAAPLRWLLAHEYFHTWNPAQLGGFANGEAAGGYWFSEGFTDYYARKLLLRDGLFSPADFAASWNDVFAAYATSPLRTADNAKVAAAFWQSEDGQKMPYYRGALFAAAMDTQARAAGSSLDAVVKRMRAEAAAHPGVEVDARFVPAYLAVTGRDPAAAEQRMLAGEPVLLSPDALGPCVRVETKDVAVFERGWDREATNRANIISGLRHDSPAYAAGLRDGMKLVQFVSGTPGDSSTAYVLRVSDATGQERTISFLPAGKGRLTRQIAVPVAGAVGGGACAP